MAQRYESTGVEDRNPGDSSPVPIQVLDLRLAQHEGKVLAFACVEFGPWIVRGLRLMRRIDGATWLAMPAQKAQNGEWRDVCFIPGRDARERLLEALEAAYRAKTSGQTESSPSVDDDTDLPF